MLVVEDISKTYFGRTSSVVALEGVSLQVAAGEFVAVCGASGCGKSTLLLTCGSLLSPDSGKVVLGDEDLYGLAPSRRSLLRAEKVGFVFQQFHLLPYLNVLDNVLVAGLALRRPANRTRAEKLIKQFELERRITHVPAELSVGERQRVGLARALLNKPSMILADEPTGNLDERSGTIVLQALDDYARGGGCVLMVTHDKGATERADHVVIMSKGKLRK